MDTLGDIISNNIATIIAILSVLVAGTSVWISYRQHGLRWAYLPPRSMLDVAEEITSNIFISFKDSKIANLTQYQFILHNTGHYALKDSAIVKPLEWTSPGRILSFRVVGTDPPVELELKDKEVVVTHPSMDLEPEEEEKEYRLEIKWPLLNQGCKALIEVLCEGGSSEPQGRIKGQIENVPRIKEKKIDSDGGQPAYRLSAPLISGVIGSGTFLGSVEGITVLLKSSEITLSEWLVPILVPIIVMLLFVGTFIPIFFMINSLVLRFANPYVRFLRKARTGNDHPTGAQS